MLRISNKFDRRTKLNVVASKYLPYLYSISNVDLIIVGTRGRSGLKRMLLGSVASEVVKHAGCPVLIIK